MRIKLVGFGAALFVGTLVQACVVSSGDEAAPQDFAIRLESYCTKTGCDENSETCERWIDDCYSDCKSLSSQYWAECASICMDIECAPCGAFDKNRCVEQGQRYVVDGPVNARVLAACQSAAATLPACGAGPVSCDGVARLYGDQAVPYFECVAQSACEDKGACASPPRTELGTEMCAGLKSVCGETAFCDPATVEQNNAASGYFVSGVTTATRKCFKLPDCASREQCLGDLIKGVTGVLNPGG